jgi:hypothetical protein
MRNWKLTFREHYMNLKISDDIATVNTSTSIFWVIMSRGLVGRYEPFGETTFSFSPEDGGSMFRRIFGSYLYRYNPEDYHHLYS